MPDVLGVIEVIKELDSKRLSLILHEKQTRMKGLHRSLHVFQEAEGSHGIVDDFEEFKRVEVSVGGLSLEKLVPQVVLVVGKEGGQFEGFRAETVLLLHFVRLELEQSGALVDGLKSVDLIEMVLETLFVLVYEINLHLGFSLGSLEYLNFSYKYSLIRNIAH